MSKTITIKLTKAGPQAGPFTISDQFGNVIAENVLRKTLIAGISYSVADNTTMLIIKSTGSCRTEKVVTLSPITRDVYSSIQFSQTTTACLWRHLTNIQLYNSYYGIIHPYIIEYPFAFQYQDEILQNVKDYTKAYEYISISDGVFNDNTRIETNDKWFTHAILYNGQQNSGLLNLVAKPLNNLKAYNAFPIYNEDSKTIVYTKSDNFYQYNTFWNVQKNSQIPSFNTGCTSLSIDKELNTSNMDYGMLSFKKATLRAKDLKIRHILKDNCTTHLVSQFILGLNQISYK
jgi:hypothetical protein